jgi:hypothetical protein
MRNNGRRHSQWDVSQGIERLHERVQQREQKKYLVLEETVLFLRLSSKKAILRVSIDVKEISCAL